MKSILSGSANIEFAARAARAGARFVVVGGVAVHFWVGDREPDDLDIMIEASPENAGRIAAVMRGITGKGAPPAVVLSRPGRLFALKPHLNVDVFTTPHEIDFARAWGDSAEALAGGVPIRIAAPRTLLLIKQHPLFGRRAKDVRDIERLRAIAA